jgi:hypothetical protein
MTFDPDLERDVQIESKYDAWLEKAEFDFDLDASYGYIEEQVREAIDGRSEESARTYLGTYGDAVTERVQHTIDEAEALLAAGHPGPATSLAATAVELTVRDLVIRPLVQGAFLSDQWAATLTNHILRGAPGEVRRLLPVIATAWGLDLDEVRLADGAGVWGVFTGPVSQARNAFVHGAEPVAPDLAARAIECARTLLDGLVVPLARRVGMNWPANPWHLAYAAGGLTIQMFEQRGPFERP